MPTHRRAHRRNRRRRMTKNQKFAVAKRFGLNGYLHTKEMVRADFNIRTDGDGLGIVNGYSTALVNQFPDSTTLEDIGQEASYANLYKQYRITGVRYQFFPIHTESLTQDTNGVGTNYLPLKQFWWKYATNGSENPQTNDGIIDLCPRVKQFSRPFSIYVRNPRPMDNVWKGSDATAGAAEAVTSGAVWLQSDNYPDVKHYGLQFGLINAQPNTTYSVKCMKTVYLSFKAPQ